MTVQPQPGRPLAGLRVLELGQVFAGPFAGSIFADLGADVVKIERTDGGDDARRMGAPFRRGDALPFHVFNRGKRSVALDLKATADLARFERLAAAADILVHNLRPGVVESMGIDGPTLCARYPRLIYCEISAFGHIGPDRLRPGYEPLIQAYSGLSSTNGGPCDPPLRLGASVCDQGTGMWAVIGALAMLRERSITGRGGIVNASLLETALAWNAQKSDAWVNLGELPERHASGHPGFAPYEAFETTDGPLLICCGNDRLFAKLAREIGHPEWIDDPRFKTNADRLANKPALFAALTARLRTDKRAAWAQRFEAVGVPCSPIHSVPEALAQAQVKALDIVQTAPGDDVRLTAMPLHFHGVRPPLAGRAPHLGEHTTMVDKP